MSMRDDDTRNSHYDHNDNILIPTTSDKEPIIFRDNDATIEGILYEIDRYYTRNGIFQSLLKHRAVSLSNGKLAIIES